MNQIETPHRGITTWLSDQGIRVIRLHYSADPLKDSAWVELNKPKAPSEEWWNQEQEIDFGARQGARIYHAYKDDDTQLVDPFPIPKEWTRYWCMDPHPRTPHAFLWGAVSPSGDLYIYRECWMSKAYATNNNVPEDDNIYPIRQYVQVLKWFESGADEDVNLGTVSEGEGDPIIKKGNPENIYGPEKIFTRLLDYAARAFGKDADNPDAMNYQERYEHHAHDIGLDLRFEDCIKDNDAAYAEVNSWFRPRPVLDENGEITQKSRIRIFKTGWWRKDGKEIFFQGCPELRWELLHNRVKMLQPHQVEMMDPQLKRIEKRNHLADDLKYLVMSKPYFYKRTPQRATWKPAFEGVGY